jgi:hypothetical protein
MSGRRFNSSIDPTAKRSVPPLAKNVRVKDGKTP